MFHVTDNVPLSLLAFLRPKAQNCGRRTHNHDKNGKKKREMQDFIATTARGTLKLTNLQERTFLKY